MTDSTICIGTGVAKTWADGAGLAPTDFRLEANTITVVRGRSGSGKSTLLAILAGWHVPTSGRVERNPRADPRRWSGTAIVPQALGLLPELPIRDNIALSARLSADVTAGDGDIDGLLIALDVAEFAERLPGELSTGQQQRAALARALLAQPTLLLIDEPTSHQDAGHVETILDLIRRATGSTTATLIATHDPAVIAVADEIIDLDA